MTPVANVANQLLSASYSPGYTETRHYNTLLQMDEQKFTTPTSGGNPAMDLHYSFSHNANNGKILGVTESVTGETINYAYDTLNRLISASGAGNPGLGAWSETFIFDGFGNLTDKNASGNATSVHMVVDPATNRLQGLNQSDPKTGNLTAIGNMQMTYDVANRVSTVAVSSVPAGMYGYDQDNHRVWTSGDQIHFFGAFGERLATFQPVSQGSPYLTQVTTDLYFAGRRIVSNGQVIMTDRLGSMRYGSNQASNFWFYPYGEEPSTTAQDRDKFATYYRDGATGLDYAQNRYYSSQLGRFLTPDPYMATASGANNPADPGSWNRYAYAGNDPVNYYDPSGDDACAVGQALPCTVTVTGLLPISGGGGSLFGSRLHYAFLSRSQIDSNGNPAGAGSGLGTSFATAQSIFEGDAQSIAKKKKFSKNCTKDFTSIGTNATAVQAAAGNAVFLNGVGNTTSLASLYATSPVPSVAQAGSSLVGTVDSFIASNPGTVAVAQLGGPDIYLNSSLINPKDYYQDMATMLHELLHNATGLTDPDIERALSLPTGGLSDVITQKLLKDCF